MNKHVNGHVSTFICLFRCFEFLAFTSNTTNTYECGWKLLFLFRTRKVLQGKKAISFGNMPRNFVMS